MSIQLVTAKEVAAALGFKPGTILDWYESGKLPPKAVYKFGNGRIRFDLELILAEFRQSETTRRGPRGVA
jgi:predicted DNA-binding transcriptional regulator AlpA